MKNVSKKLVPWNHSYLKYALSMYGKGVGYQWYFVNQIVKSSKNDQKISNCENVRKGLVGYGFQNSCVFVSAFNVVQKVTIKHI